MITHYKPEGKPVGWGLLFLALPISLLLAIATIHPAITDAPAMAEVPAAPPDIAGLANEEHGIHNALPYFIVCFFAAVVLEAGLKIRRRIALAIVSILASMLLLGVELSQFAAPVNGFSISDLLWGTAGIFGGTFSAFGFCRFYKRGHGHRFLRLKDRIVGHRTRIVERAFFLTTAGHSESGPHPHPSGSGLLPVRHKKDR